MRHWIRSVRLGDELGEYLERELKRRWPESEYLYHIEVTASEAAGHLEVRVWNERGVNVIQEAHPERFFAPSAKSPTVAALLDAIESAMDTATKRKRQ